jgi:hypothetical protein
MRKICTILPTMSRATSPSSSTMRFKTKLSGYSTLDREKMRQKSFLGVGPCSSNTPNTPLTPMSTKSRSASMSSSKNSTSTLIPPQPMNICSVKVLVWYICRTNAAASFRMSLGNFFEAYQQMVGMPPKKDKLSCDSESSCMIMLMIFSRGNTTSLCGLVPRISRMGNMP